jgi:predicted Zn-ribbon and HTH transcriptional regulator
MTSTCRHCNYEWESKVETPKACPRCKRRLDFERQILVKVKQEVEN